MIISQKFEGSLRYATFPQLPKIYPLQWLSLVSVFCDTFKIVVEKTRKEYLNSSLIPEGFQNDILLQGRCSVVKSRSSPVRHCGPVRFDLELMESLGSMGSMGSS